VLTKMQFRAIILINVGFAAAMMLPRLWAAKHSLDEGASGVLADSIQAAA
jgi:hypothetical protein